MLTREKRAKLFLCLNDYYKVKGCRGGIAPFLLNEALRGPYHQGALCHYLGYGITH